MVFVLAFIGLKMILAHWYPIPHLLSLMVIVLFISLGIIASLVVREGPAERDKGPLMNELRVLAWITVNQARRLIVILLGLTLLLFGLALLVLPGPAIIVIPVGLGLLARELVWAKRLLRRFEEKGTDIIDLFNRTPHDKT